MDDWDPDECAGAPETPLVHPDPAVQAAVERIDVARREYLVARLHLDIAATEATDAFRAFEQAWRSGPVWN